MTGKEAQKQAMKDLERNTPQTMISTVAVLVSMGQTLNQILIELKAIRERIEIQGG